MCEALIAAAPGLVLGKRATRVLSSAGCQTVWPTPAGLRCGGCGWLLRRACFCFGKVRCRRRSVRGDGGVETNSWFQQWAHSTAVALINCPVPPPGLRLRSDCCRCATGAAQLQYAVMCACCRDTRLRIGLV